MRSTTFHRFKKYPGLLASCNKIVKESSIPQSNIFHGASLKAMQENDDQADYSCRKGDFFQSKYDMRAPVGK